MRQFTGIDSMKCGTFLFGLALISASCENSSTSVSSPPAEGAVSLTVQDSQSAPSDYSCYPPVPHSRLIAYEAPSATSQGIPFVDGQDHTNVKCSVTGSDQYAFSATIEGWSNRFVVQGSVQVGGTGTAKIDFYDGLMSLDVTADNCVIALDGNYEVEPGAIWASFSCDELRSTQDTYLWCAVSGVLVLKNCAK